MAVLTGGETKRALPFSMCIPSSFLFEPCLFWTESLFRKQYLLLQTTLCSAVLFRRLVLLLPFSLSVTQGVVLRDELLGKDMNVVEVHFICLLSGNDLCVTRNAYAHTPQTKPTIKQIIEQPQTHDFLLEEQHFRRRFGEHFHAGQSLSHRPQLAPKIHLRGFVLTNRQRFEKQ